MIYTSFLFRIFLSLLLGFLIGLERQLTGHPAGIRINVLICMGTSFLLCFQCFTGRTRCFVSGAASYPVSDFCAAG